MAVPQKCITKAKNQKGKISVRYIKILFTGSGAAGKTSFSHLLMKNKFIDVHRSTNIIHAASVKKAIVVGSNQSHDQNVVWLEMDDNSQNSHLREILLSLDVQSLPNSNETNPPPHNKEPQLSMANTSNNHSSNTQEASVKQRSSLIRKRATGWFSGSVTFNSLLQGSVMSSTTDQYFELSGEVLNIITPLDTGGQSEYIHLLPTINIHPVVTFVVHDLSKNLEDEVLVEYSENGKLVFEPYHLTYSNFDMIKFLLSGINDSFERTSSQVSRLAAVSGKSNSSYLCCVGTHADKIDMNTIHNIGIELTAMIEKLRCKVTVWEDDGVLFPVDNTTAGDDNKEDPIASFIRKKVDELATDKDVYELPITWMLFELEIQKICSSSGKTYISFEECCSIAHQTNLLSGMDEINSALIYHHMLGVLLYFTDVPGLCDYMITNHQWLFDKISSVVYCTFKHSFNKLAKNNLKHDGILSKELIQELKWKEEIKEHFIALLVKMDIVAPIQGEDGNGWDYFIPCILPTYTTQPQCNNILSQYYGCLQGEPLLIQFTSNLLPRGFFCSLVVQILQQLPKVLDNLFTQRDARHTYSNLITFHIQNAYSLSLIDKLSHLAIQIRHEESHYFRQVPIHNKVKENLSVALKTVCEQSTFNHGRIQYGFHCQCEEHDDHIAVLTSPIPPFDYGLCRCGSNVTTKLSNEHTVWLQNVR